MKRLTYLVVAVLFVILLLSVGAAFAQKSLRQVPITYPGDNDKTIARRAQWIEGAKKEGTVVKWGSDEPAATKEIAAEFNKIYPFIKVDYWRGQGTEGSVRAEAEHSIGRVTVDICEEGDGSAFPRWRKIGLVEKYIDFIPGLEKRDKRSYSKYGDWAQLGNNAFVPTYNTNLVQAAEAPKSWEDLLNPKWKGRIGMSADAKPWYTLALGDEGWGIEKTEDFLRKLKQQEPIWARGYGAARTLLTAGEFKIMGADIIRNVLMIQKRSPVDWCRVRPVPITGGVFFLTKKAPHPNAARLFIEWIFSPQGLATVERVTGYASVAPGSGTIQAKALEGLPFVYRTEEVLLKVGELGLINRFSKILGIAPE